MTPSGMFYPRCILQTTQGEALAVVPLSPQETVYAALQRSRWPLRSTCGGSTICGRCRVTLLDADLPPPPALEDERLLLGAEAPARVRLGCRLRLPPGGAWLRLSTPYWPSPASSAQEPETG